MSAKYMRDCLWRSQVEVRAISTMKVTNYRFGVEIATKITRYSVPGRLNTRHRLIIRIDSVPTAVDRDLSRPYKGRGSEQLHIHDSSLYRRAGMPGGHSASWFCKNQNNKISNTHFEYLEWVTETCKIARSFGSPNIMITGVGPSFGVLVLVLDLVEYTWSWNSGTLFADLLR